jgi:hypothetical protein
MAVYPLEITRFMRFPRKTIRPISQLEFPLEQPVNPDRNHAQGGRSFYFFDFDDNVVCLPTPLFLFHRHTGEERELSTREFAFISDQIGKAGEWEHFEIKACPQTGSFRRFRHKHFSLFERLKRRKQPLIEDLLLAIEKEETHWKGPSWNFFSYAVHNGRPLSIITARGHRPETLKESIGVLVRQGHLSRHPNYLSVYPVSNMDVRRALGDPQEFWHTARLKQEAIKSSVEAAFRVYGPNPNHRFGMSDDDPVNIKLIIEAMQDLKRKYPRNSFFVIDTHQGRLFKQEILADSVESPEPFLGEQLSLFK